MAKRAAAPRKPARARARDAGFEVQDQTVEQAPRAPLESALVVVTFIALFIALVLSQVELSSTYGRGMF